MTSMSALGSGDVAMDGHGWPWIKKSEKVSIIKRSSSKKMYSKKFILLCHESIESIQHIPVLFVVCSHSGWLHSVTQQDLLDVLTWVVFVRKPSHLFVQGGPQSPCHQLLRGWISD